LEDDGIPYNPLKNPDPDLDKFLEQGKIGGFGIFLVKQSMDDVQYEYANEKNRITITKNR
jgi:anti-sigma regulatory factor (Ser/Thr protein kinase)